MNQTPFLDFDRVASLLTDGFLEGTYSEVRTVGGTGQVEIG